MKKAFDGFEIKVLGVRHYKVGYEIRTERVTNPDDGEAVVMKSAYTPRGEYIGSSRWAHRLIAKRGIVPELTPDTRVCSIGFCKVEQKWYGWSHRAMYGFGVGDRVETEDHLCAASGWTEEYLAEHPEEDHSLPVGFEAKTLADCKQMAVAFARAVS